MANDNPIATNKIDGIKLNQTATGRALAVITIPGLAMFRIAFVDGKQGGQIPNRFSGRYTNAKLAQADLSRFVAETWAIAEEATRKTKKTIAA